MQIVLVISLLVVTVASLFLTGWVAVHVSEALERTLRVLDASHSRDNETLQTTLDRLMARDLDHFKTYDLIEPAEAGVDETSVEELKAARPWLAVGGGGLHETTEFDPEAEGLPQ